MSDVALQLKQFGKIKLNEPMSKHTTFQIGGTVDYFVVVENLDNLLRLLQYVDDEGIPRMILGGGSNVLWQDDRFEGVVIQMKNSEFRMLNMGVECSAGAKMKEVSQATVEAGLTGFTWAIGVPGTIAGALRGNAAYNGIAMEDSVEKVEVYRDGEVLELSNAECEFGYKESVFKNNLDVILRIWLKLEKGDKAVLAKEAMENTAYRDKSQPHGFGSAGCTFKNVVVASPEMKALAEKIDDERVQDVYKKFGKIPVGRLIDLVEMKGVKHGGAMISDVHANFILNMGHATAEDVKFLIEQVKEKVYDRYGVALEEEICVVR